MESFKKIIRIGKTRDAGNLFCRIKFHDGKLSITGVEGPKANGDCRGACGQIVMHEWELIEYAQGWSADSVRRFRAVWNEWHLNDMRAGNAVQMAYLADMEANGGDWRDGGHKSHYEFATAALDSAGLNPQGDRYGHKWHKVDVPNDVLEWLKGLPDSGIAPAWV